MKSPLTKEVLDKAREALMKISVPTVYCDTCKQPVYSLHPIGKDEKIICFSCLLGDVEKGNDR